MAKKKNKTERGKETVFRSAPYDKYIVDAVRTMPYHTGKFDENNQPIFQMMPPHYEYARDDGAVVSGGDGYWALPIAHENVVVKDEGSGNPLRVVRSAPDTQAPEPPLLGPEGLEGPWLQPSEMPEFDFDAGKLPADQKSAGARALAEALTERTKGSNLVDRSDVSPGFRFREDDKRRVRMTPQRWLELTK